MITLHQPSINYSSWGKKKARRVWEAQASGLGMSQWLRNKLSGTLVCLIQKGHMIYLHVSIIIYIYIYYHLLSSIIIYYHLLSSIIIYYHLLSSIIYRCIAGCIYIELAFWTPPFSPPCGGRSHARCWAMDSFGSDDEWRSGAWTRVFEGGKSTGELDCFMLLYFAGEFLKSNGCLLGHKRMWDVNTVKQGNEETDYFDVLILFCPWKFNHSNETIHSSRSYYHHWLVVWNMFYFPIYWE